MWFIRVIVNDPACVYDNILKLYHMCDDMYKWAIGNLKASPDDWYPQLDKWFRLKGILLWKLDSHMCTYVYIYTVCTVHISIQCVGSQTNDESSKPHPSRTKNWN